MAQNLLQVMCICSAVILSYLNAGFEPRFPQKTFYVPATCCCCQKVLLTLHPKRG